MGIEVTLKMRYVVKKVGEGFDDGTRLFSFLRELTAGGLLIEPVRVHRDRRLNQLVCVVGSWLRNKGPGERFFAKRKYPATYLPSLCKRYQVAVEVWASCCEIGHDEHYVVDYNGKVTIQEDMKTLSLLDDLNAKPRTTEQKEWSTRWGKWTVPTAAEYAAEKEHRHRFLAEQRARQKRMAAKLEKHKPGEPIPAEDFFSLF